MNHCDVCGLPDNDLRPAVDPRAPETAPQMICDGCNGDWDLLNV